MRSVMAFPLLLAGGMLLGNASLADDSASFNYAELSYVRADADLGATLGSLDGNGGRFEFSFEFIDMVYAVGSYEKIDFGDITVTDPISGGTLSLGSIELDEWSAGVGWHTRTPSRTASFSSYGKDRWAFFAEARYLSLDAGSGPDSRVDGYRARLGFRGVNHTKFEFLGAVGYRDLETADGDITVEARLLYEVIDNLDIQLGVDWVEDFTRGFVGVRYSFRRSGG